MKKSKVSVAIITLLAVVLALALAGCGDSSNGSGTGSEKQKDYFEIKTEAGNLRYPDQWEDVSKVDVSTKDGVTSVVFRGKEKGKTFTLFTVQIGGKGDNAVGTIKDKKGKERDVFMKTYSYRKNKSYHRQGAKVLSGRHTQPRGDGYCF